MIAQLVQLFLTVWSVSAMFTGVEDLEITNLSPLLRYDPHPIPGNTDPEAGWVTDEYGTWTNTAQNASVSLLWWGGETTLYGNLSRVITRVNADHIQANNAGSYAPNDWWMTWPQVQYRQSLDGPGSRSNGSWTTEERLGQTGIAFETRRPETPYVDFGDRDLVPFQTWNVTFELDQTSMYNRLINVSKAIIGVGLPVSVDWYETTLVPAPERVVTVEEGADDWTSPMEGSWESRSAPFNATRYGGRQLQSTFRPATFAAVQDTAGRVLSTNTSDAPLKLHAPEEAALFVMYGAVGPQQGEFAVRLNVLDGGSEKDFYPHGDTLYFTANRQEEAMSEVLAVMWLDPRLRYDVEVVSTEAGRNLAIQAVAWTTSPINGATGNWWSQWNDQALGRGNGLSGGQIAGIVVGSVVGAALILGMAIFFWRRHRKRASASAPATEASLSPSHTLTGEAPTSKPPAAV